MLPLNNIGLLHVFKGIAEIPGGDSRFFDQNRNPAERGLNKDGRLIFDDDFAKGI
jgi:hypothetical protein